MRRFIDVAYYQGNIDWEKAWNSKLFDFVILRCGYGDDIPKQDDKKWKRNVSECERLGIPYGVYFYSYAATDQQVASEVKHCLRLLKDCGPNFKYPVFYDLEDNVRGPFAKRAAQLFIPEIEKAGYKAGIYTYHSFINSWFKGTFLDSYLVWVARYGSVKPSYAKTWAWQFSSKQSVPGIKGRVDMSMILDEGKLAVSTPVVQPETHVQLNYQPGQTYYANVKASLRVRSSASTVNTKNVIGSINRNEPVVNLATMRTPDGSIWMYLGTMKKGRNTYQKWACADDGKDAYLVDHTV